MTNFLGTTDSQPLAIRTNNSEKMRIDASGNVGIGIVPQSRFHINGTSWFQGDTTPLPASAGQGIAMGYGSAAYIFAFDYSTLTPRTLLLNHPGGTVGIGTATPCSTTTLHVFGGPAGVGCFDSALLGESQNFVGVVGVSASDTGVWGISGRSHGVSGDSGSRTGVIASSISGTYIYEGWDSSSDRRFAVVRATGTVLADGAYSGPADFAEMINVSGTKEDYEPGDVLAIGADGKLMKTNAPYASNLAGVYSTKPGFVGDTEIAESGIDEYENRTTFRNHGARIRKSCP